ncbi:MAG: AMP-binding protein [Acidobacteriota bacterium]
MRRSKSTDPRTLRDLVDTLTTLPGRHAIGLHGDIGTRWWTRRRLRDEILHAAAWLAEKGVGPGDRYVLWAANSLEWCAFFLAASLRGAVAVLVDRELGAEFVEAVVAETKSRLVVHDRPAIDRALGPDVPTLGVYTLGEHAPVIMPDGIMTPAPDDDAAVLYSSGTTARPKGITVTHANLIAQLMPFRRLRGPARIAPVGMMVIPPLSHILGLGTGLLLSMYLRLRLVLCAGSGPVAWIRAARATRAQLIVAVPRIVEALATAVEKSRLGTHDSLAVRARTRGRRARQWLAFRHRQRLLGSWFRAFVVGGNKLPTATVRFWQRTGILVIQGYGLTETTGIVSVSNPLTTRGLDIGRPVAAYDIRLAPDGEILVRGDQVAPHGTPVDDDGFFATGDLATWDGADRLVFLGRKKDVIVTADGYNLHPVELEERLDRQPGVRESVVIARGEGEATVAHAVLVMEDDANPAEAMRAANQNLPPHFQIRSWTRWPEASLPRNSLMKVRRVEVMRRLDSIASQPASTNAATTMAAVLASDDRDETVRRLADLLAVTDSTDTEAETIALTELGLSSLDLLTVIAGIESRCGVELSSPRVDEHTTVADLRAQLTSGDVVPAQDDRASDLPNHQPWWAGTVVASWLRPFVRAVAIGFWSWMSARIESRWHYEPSRVKPPFLIAAMPHVSWLDTFVVFSALPPALRRTPFVTTDHDFAPWFAPRHTTWLARVLSGAGYYLGLPALFPFTILASGGRAREGLRYGARLLERGHNAISFPEGLIFFRDQLTHHPGIALLARETGSQLVPTYIEAAERTIGWRWRRPRPTITVHFGTPITPRPDQDLSEITAAVHTAWETLRTTVHDEKNRATPHGSSIDS